MAAGMNLSLEALGVNLPYSMEAEQAVLGAAILDVENIPKMVEALRPEMFYARQNGEIFSEIVRLFTAGAPVDFVTLLAAVQDAGTFATEEEAKVYLTQLEEKGPSLSHIGTYVNIIAEKYRVRQLIGVAKTILEQTAEETDPELLLESAEQKIYQIRAGRDSSALSPISSVIIDTFAHLQEISGPNREKYLVIPTGFRYLDTMLTGLGRSDLIILAARPGMGKTSFALNVLLHAGKFSGKTAVFFSLEMSREQLAMRLISNEAFVDNKKLVTGKLGDEDWDKIALASAALGRSKILIDDNPSLSVADMNAKCRRVDNLGLVVIDYLQLMQSAGGKQRYSGENRQQVVSDISRALKIMAKELNVPVVCLSQLSRGPESRSDKRPMLSDLRESGAIEQDADIVMFLYRDDYYNEDSERHNLAECIIAKNRHGETGKVELQWLPEYTTFSSIDRTHEEY